MNDLGEHGESLKHCSCIMQLPAALWAHFHFHNILLHKIRIKIQVLRAYRCTPSTYPVKVFRKNSLQHEAAILFVTA